MTAATQDQPQAPDTKPGAYFVSALNGRSVALLALAALLAACQPHPTPDPQPMPAAWCIAPADCYPLKEVKP